MRFSTFFIGDVHFYGFYDDSWNPNAYPIARFMSETGAVCLPSLDTWYQVTKNLSDLDFWSDLVEHRQHYGGGQKLMMFVIDVFLYNNQLIKKLYLF
jgi:hypothetical protein